MREQSVSLDDTKHASTITCYVQRVVIYRITCPVSKHADSIPVAKRAASGRTSTLASSTCSLVVCFGAPISNNSYIPVQNGPIRLSLVGVWFTETMSVIKQDRKSCHSLEHAGTAKTAQKATCSTEAKDLMQDWFDLGNVANRHTFNDVIQASAPSGHPSNNFCNKSGI